MKAKTVLVILLISLAVHNMDAKGFGYKRMKSPGRKMKMPKPKMGMGKGMGMGMGMGIGAGMGMGLGMGIGAALLIPVVIPMRHGYGRHRNSYRYGTQCYVCEGMDNDVCVTSPATISRRESCPSNQYCSVLRREILFQPDPVEHHRHSVSRANASAASSNTIHSMAANDAAITALKTSETGNTKVLISRGCKPPDVLQSHQMTSTGMSGDTTKTYIQFCLTELCNVGDGRLKCYDCDGEGSNHMCMVNPSEGAKIVTCESNEYCNILRTTTINFTASANGPVESITVFISRGCKAAGVTGEDYSVEEGTSILSLSCSSDLCNYVDGADLAAISSANGLNLYRFSSIIFLSLLVFLLRQ